MGITLIPDRDCTKKKKNLSYEIQRKNPANNVNQQNEWDIKKKI